MVNSTTVLADLDRINYIFYTYLDSINNLEMFWQGLSKDNLETKANDFVSIYKGIINGQMNSLANAIDMYEEYKMWKEKYKNAEINYNNAIASEDPEASTYQQYMTDADVEMKKLKLQIEALLELIKSQKISEAIIPTDTINTPVQEIVNETNVNNPTNFNNLNIDINELEKNMSNLRILSSKENLADFYEDGYVENIINEIKSSDISGREKAVLSALTLIKLAADKGVKLDYEWGGSHGSPTLNNVLKQGADCSSFVSFLFNQGSNSNHNYTTATLENKYSKYTIPYESAQPGDILNVNSSAGQHVEMIIENHPEEGYFITAEARSSKHGIELTKITYDKAKNKRKFAAYNMDNVYTQ